MFSRAKTSTFAVTLVLNGVFFIAYNAWILWYTVICVEEAPSTAPIVGGVIATPGVVFLPVNDRWMWLWIPLMIDWGGLPLFLTVWYFVRGK